ncbi:MAG: hypothetical protein ACC633_02960 [Anaerolineales bacterium]
MYNTTEKRSSHLIHWLAVLLVLTAMSLMSHYLTDAVHFSAGTCWSCRIQEIGESHQVGENAHASDLHGYFMLNELSVLGPNPMRMILGDVTAPLELAWIPPSPDRPPIVL